MSERVESRTLRDHLQVLRQRRLIVLLTTLVVIGASVAYVVLKDPKYQAEAALSFADEREDLGLLGTTQAPTPEPEKVAAKNAQTVTRQDVVERVKKKLGTKQSTGQLRDSVRVQVEPDSNLVVIKAKAGSGKGAASLANEFAKQAQRVATQRDRRRFGQAAKDLEAELADIKKQQGPPRPGPGGRPAPVSGLALGAYADRISRFQSLSLFARPVEIVKLGNVPRSPSSPKPARDITLAAMLGLILGVMLAFVRDAVDRRVRDSHELQHELGLPLLGYVRNEALGHAGLTRNGQPDPNDNDLEAFRILRSNAEFLDVDRSVHSVAITSAVAEEGKSTVALGLAMATAAAGKRTLLLEADLRRSVIAQRLGIQSTPGLTDYLANRASPQELVQTVPVRLPAPAPAAVGVDERAGPGALFCITAGTPTPGPAEMLSSQRFRDLLTQMTVFYDAVILDTSPLLPVSDTLEIIPHVDEVLVCVRLFQTTHEEAAAGRSALDHLPRRPTGLVITGVRPGAGGDYYAYYGAYGYRSDRIPEPDAAASH
jgi:tyrosine-protein kinase